MEIQKWAVKGCYRNSLLSPGTKVPFSSLFWQCCPIFSSLQMAVRAPAFIDYPICILGERRVTEVERQKTCFLEACPCSKKCSWKFCYLTSAYILLATSAVRIEKERSLNTWSSAQYVSTWNENWDFNAIAMDEYWVNYLYLCHNPTGCPDPKQTVKRSMGCPLPLLSPSHPHLGTNTLLLQRKKKKISFTFRG